MNYKITYIVDSDYCNLQPDNEECKRVVEIIADTKTEAVMKLHEIYNMTPTKGKRCQPTSLFPVVWSIEEIPYV